MVHTYTYLPVEQVVYGSGAVNELSRIVDEFNALKVVVLTTKSLANSQALKQIEGIVGKRHLKTFYNEISQHVPSKNLLQLANQLKQLEIDLVISFGGGSVIDSAKALALILAENIETEENLYEYSVKFRYPDYLFIPKVYGNTIPHVAIPTTLSAAEFSHITGITNTDKKVKELYMDDKLTPRRVILDPVLTLETPMWLWLSTGIRAIDHAVETIYSKNHQIITDTFAYKALSMLNENLLKTKNSPEDLDARLNCQLAAWMSFFGVTNVMLGLCHGIGHQIGAHCNVPHGYTSCIMLPHVMRYTLPSTIDRQKTIAEALGVNTSALSEEDAARSAAEEVEKLIRSLELPTRLRDVGVKEEDFVPIAKDALEDMVVASSPQPVEDQETIIRLLRLAW